MFGGIMVGVGSVLVAKVRGRTRWGTILADDNNNTAEHAEMDHPIEHVVALVHDPLAQRPLLAAHARVLCVCVFVCVFFMCVLMCMCVFSILLYVVCCILT